LTSSTPAMTSGTPSAEFCPFWLKPPITPLMVGTLAYKKFKLEGWFPNISYLHTPECCI